MELKSERMGRLMNIEGGQAYLPGPFSPEKGPIIDWELSTLLSEADLSLGRLDGLSDLLPYPDLFVMMYIKKEAVWSSQIEGTQASLMDVLEFEAEALRPDAPRDVKEVVNYIKALHRGIELIEESHPFDLDLIRELHSILMKDTRGGTLSPGKFRNVQNWVGPPGCGLKDAIFVPPPPMEMNEALKDLEGSMMGEKVLPPLVKAAMIHVRFESIHPFIDGNGRMGRLLIILSLFKDGHLRSPLLYISHYLKQMRSTYYEKLQNVRINGDLEGWLKFFFVGISQVSEEASERARRILRLSKEMKEKVQRDLGKNGRRGSILLDSMLMRPVLGIKEIAEITELSYQNDNKLASQLERIGILKEVTGQKRNRVFEFKEYLDLLNE